LIVRFQWRLKFCNFSDDGEAFNGRRSLPYEVVMKVAIASDHRGFHLKEQLIALLKSRGHEVLDEGPMSEGSVDYPDFAALVARKISAGEAERGILICGTGIGMAISANKFPGVRAAACADEVTAELSRRHNDLNVLCLSGDLLSSRVAERVVEKWLETEFEGGRHHRRVEKIRDLERENHMGP
jgi:ribose 5-phosphate isomerase B